MATLGNSTTPSGGFIYDDFGSGYEYWTAFTLGGSGGVVTDIYVYAGGDGVSWTGYLVIWSGNNVAWSGSITFPSNTRTNGGQQWLHLAVPNVYITPGTVNLGYWAGGNTVWTQEGSGTTARSNNTGLSPFGLGGNGTGAGNALGAYIVYNPAGVYINTGTPAAPVWTAAEALINTGTPAAPVWTPANGIYINTGTPAAPVWTPGG